MKIDNEPKEISWMGGYHMAEPTVINLFGPDPPWTLKRRIETWWRRQFFLQLFLIWFFGLTALQLLLHSL